MPTTDLTKGIWAFPNDDVINMRAHRTVARGRSDPELETVEEESPQSKLSRGVRYSKLSTEESSSAWVLKVVLLLAASIVMLTIAVLGVLMYIMPWVFHPCEYHVERVNPVSAHVIRTIAFGSCVNSKYQVPIFDEIDADVMVFLGDSVYADTDSPESMQRSYNKLSCKPEFQSLVERTRYVLAIWDDHDYGDNDIGSENPIKREAMSIFSNFWNINADRRRINGVYGVYKFKAAKINVTIILPDLRFFRDHLQICDPKPYHDNNNEYCPTNGTMIGASQWRWLEGTIKEAQKPNSLTILASSTQFGHSPNGYESWNNFPRDRERLRKLLDPSISIVISGDVHWGEISIQVSRG